MTPTETTATTAATHAAATAAQVPLWLSPLGLSMSDYGIVAISAFAAGLIQLSAMEKRNLFDAFLTVFRVMFVSLALTSSIAYIVVKAFELPSPVALSLVSFVLGLSDGKWSSMWEKAFDTILKILEAVLPNRGK